LFFKEKTLEDGYRPKARFLEMNCMGKWQNLESLVSSLVYFAWKKASISDKFKMLPNMDAAQAFNDSVIYHDSWWKILKLSSKYGILIYVELKKKLIILN
jgi:hypothetical protein